MEPDLYVPTDLATSLVLDSNTGGNVYTKGFDGEAFQKWNVEISDHNTYVLRDLATKATGALVGSSLTHQVSDSPGVPTPCATDRVATKDQLGNHPMARRRCHPDRESRALTAVLASPEQKDH
jgi:hypothetical protein